MVKRLRLRPLTPATGVRIPVESPKNPGGNTKTICIFQKNKIFNPSKYRIQESKKSYWKTRNRDLSNLLKSNEKQKSYLFLFGIQFLAFVVYVISTYCLATYIIATVSSILSLIFAFSLAIINFFPTLKWIDKQ